MKNTIGSDKDKDKAIFSFFAFKLQCLGYSVRNEHTWLLNHGRKILYHMI